MYPYKTRITWLIRGGHAHFIDAVKDQPGALRGTHGKTLKGRLLRMQVWLKVRLAIVIILSASLIGTVYGFIADYVGSTEAADRAFGLLTTISSTFAGAFGLLYLFAGRLLDQLRADAEVCLAVQASKGTLHK